MNRTNLIRSLIKHEGFKYVPYIDKLGYLTVGIGHRTKNKKLRLTSKQIYKILDKDIVSARKVAYQLFGSMAKYKNNIQNFMIEMSFNLGYRLRSFKKANKALILGDYTKAKIEYKDSKWAGQVGRTRVKDMLKMLHK